MLLLLQAGRDGRGPRKLYGSAWLDPISERPGSTFRRTLAEGAELTLDPQQTNYLVNVMRLGAGDSVLLFNGRDGEFAATPCGEVA